MMRWKRRSRPNPLGRVTERSRRSQRQESLFSTATSLRTTSGMLGQASWLVSRSMGPKMDALYGLKVRQAMFIIPCTVHKCRGTTSSKNLTGMRTYICTNLNGGSQDVRARSYKVIFPSAQGFEEPLYHVVINP